MTTKKPARPRPSRARAKSPAQRQKQYYDIATNEVVNVPEDAFVNELVAPTGPPPNFKFSLHDGNFAGAVKLETQGDAELGIRKLCDLYLIDDTFRDFVNSIINGALAKQAESIKKQLSSLIVKR